MCFVCFLPSYSLRLQDTVKPFQNTRKYGNRTARAADEQGAVY